MSVVQINNSSNEQKFKRTIVQAAVVQMRIHPNQGKKTIGILYWQTYIGPKIFPIQSRHLWHDRECIIGEWYMDKATVYKC